MKSSFDELLVIFKFLFQWKKNSTCVLTQRQIYLYNNATKQSKSKDYLKYLRIIKLSKNPQTKNIIPQPQRERNSEQLI